MHGGSRGSEQSVWVLVMNTFVCQAVEYGICSVASGEQGTSQNQLLPYIKASDIE